MNLLIFCKNSNNCYQEEDELMTEQEKKEYQTVILTELLHDVGKEYGIRRIE